MKKVKIKVEQYELNLIIRALFEWRNALLKEGKPAEDIEDLLLRLCG